MFDSSITSLFSQLPQWPNDRYHSSCGDSCVLLLCLFNNGSSYWVQRFICLQTCDWLLQWIKYRKTSLNQKKSGIIYLLCLVPLFSAYHQIAGTSLAIFVCHELEISLLRSAHNISTYRFEATQYWYWMRNKHWSVEHTWESIQMSSQRYSPIHQLTQFLPKWHNRIHSSNSASIPYSNQHDKLHYPHTFDVPWIQWASILVHNNISLCNDRALHRVLEKDSLWYLMWLTCMGWIY